MMLRNREVFQRDPTTYSLPNDGVAKVVEPRTDDEWKVARYELEQFVCEDSYHEGLRRILESYLANLGQPTQRAAWVHGFYGCGKSHLVRVLEFLWRDVRFPDGATARGAANLPDDIRDALRELSNAGRQRGGLWSAAGALGAGSPNEPRAAILGIVLRSAGLPERVNLAQFDLWVRQEGWMDAIRSGLEQRGRSYERELRNLFLSTPLAEELLKVNPRLGSSAPEVLSQIRAQFPEMAVTTEVLVDMMRQVFELKSDKPDKLPCVLLVLDELQQYLGDSTEKTDAVQDAVQAAVSRFESNLLFVATGQSALQATSLLQKLQGRFTIHVALEDKDTEKVLRQTVLQKKTSVEPELDSLLDSVRGEIDRHLGGTQIERQSADPQVMAADYPLLPTRRRFWQKVMRAIDRSGTTAQLRTHLRLAHEAARAVGDKSIGHVVGGDFIFDQQRSTLLQTAVLLRDIDETIAAQEDGTEDGKLRARICALLFLIKQVDPNVGIKATADTLADLLVTDLCAGSASLRQKIPQLLDQLIESGAVMQVGDEYHVQTREGAEWDHDYRSRMAAVKGDDSRISAERHRLLREGAEGLFGGGMTLTQGGSKTPRHIELHFGPDAPEVGAKVPIWVRSGWDVSESAVVGDSAAAGAESPIVFVFLPRQQDEDLRAQIAGYLAAKDVLDTRAAPTTDEGNAAKASIEARRDAHNDTIRVIVSDILDNARVFQGGGTEVQGMDLRSSLERAVQASLLRLYPRFPEADLTSWNSVSNRARQGAPDALVITGYSGEVGQHPVCREILAFVGISGKLGNEVRRHFEAPPYGWPRDAIDAGLLVVSASHYLKVTYKTNPIPVSELTGTTIQQAEFRAEQKFVTTAQRLEIRKFLQGLGISKTSGEEAIALSGFLDRMKTLAEAAGGPPPLPEKPSVLYIESLRELSGNDLVAAAYEKLGQLGRGHSDWNSAREKAAKRVPRWEMLQELLEHARGLPPYDEVEAEAHAILEQRKLLQDPDPVVPLMSRLAGALRAAVTEARQHHLEAYDAKMGELLRNDNWQRLHEEKQQEIRKRRGLGPLPPLDLDTDENLLKELKATPLSAWEDKTAAVAERIAQALLDAAKESEPSAERLSLPPATIRTEEDLDAYLSQVRDKAMKIIGSGRPVVLS